MNSSYLSKIDFGDIIKIITQLNNPQSIVEFGILDGFSLQCFANESSSTCNIEAYDIFEEFIGNGAKYDATIKKFNAYSKVSIHRGDFFKCITNFKNNSIDILHIDIANNGEVYDFAFTNYIHKIKKGGLMILEGGSKERDNIDWMLKYNKPKIQPIIQKYKDIYKIFVVDKFPSMTIVMM